MKKIPCQIIFNGPKNGYIFTPIECESISAALSAAKEWAMPFRIFDMNGKLLKRGWKI